MKKDELLNLMDSWENLASLIKGIGDYPEYFGLLMEVALNSDGQKSWRAAWMADKIHDRFPGLINPYLVPMVLKLKDLKDMGKKRQFLKLISLHEIPDIYSGFLVGYCLDTLSSAEPPAVRVHAMQVLYNISEAEHDMKPELIGIIEQEIEFRPTPGVIARGSKLVKKLRKQINWAVSSE